MTEIVFWGVVVSIFALIVCHVLILVKLERDHKKWLRENDDALR